MDQHAFKKKLNVGMAIQFFQEIYVKNAICSIHRSHSQIRVTMNVSTRSLAQEDTMEIREQRTARFAIQLSA